MSDPLTAATEKYLETLSLAIVGGINSVIGESMSSLDFTVTNEQTSDDSESAMQKIVYRGKLYNAKFTKDAGPSTTVVMKLRQR